MKKIIVAISLVAAMGMASAAQAGFMDAAYGNTVTVADGNGAINSSFHFNEGGAFTIITPDGQSMDGTWRTEGSSVCFALGENEECHEVQDIAVGESWSEPNEDGSTTVISIVAGR